MRAQHSSIEATSDFNASLSVWSGLSALARCERAPLSARELERVGAVEDARERLVGLGTAHLRRATRRRREKAEEARMYAEREHAEREVGRRRGGADGGSPARAALGRAPQPRAVISVGVGLRVGAVLVFPVGVGAVGVGVGRRVLCVPGVEVIDFRLRRRASSSAICARSRALYRV